MPNTDGKAGSLSSTPNYLDLVRFLVEPFLSAPSSLSVDCEYSHDRQRVLIRMACEGDDKGRVFGRGGRNLQAVRSVLSAAATLAGQSVRLDVYESPSARSEQSRDAGRSRPPGGRFQGPRPAPRLSPNPPAS